MPRHRDSTRNHTIEAHTPESQVGGCHLLRPPSWAKIKPDSHSFKSRPNITAERVPIMWSLTLTVFKQSKNTIKQCFAAILCWSSWSQLVPQSEYFEFPAAKCNNNFHYWEGLSISFFYLCFKLQFPSYTFEASLANQLWSQPYIHWGRHNKLWQLLMLMLLLVLIARVHWRIG